MYNHSSVNIIYNYKTISFLMAHHLDKRRFITNHHRVQNYSYIFFNRFQIKILHNSINLTPLAFCMLFLAYRNFPSLKIETSVDLHHITFHPSRFTSNITIEYCPYAVRSRFFLVTPTMIRVRRLLGISGERCG